MGRWIRAPPLPIREIPTIACSTSYTPINVRGDRWRGRFHSFARPRGRYTHTQLTCTRRTCAVRVSVAPRIRRRRRRRRKRRPLPCCGRRCVACSIPGAWRIDRRRTRTYTTRWGRPATERRRRDRKIAQTPDVTPRWLPGPAVATAAVPATRQSDRPTDRPTLSVRRQDSRARRRSSARTYLRGGDRDARAVAPNFVSRIIPVTRTNHPLLPLTLPLYQVV